MPKAAFLSGALLAVAGASAQTTTTIVCDRDNTLYEDPTGSLSNGAGGAVFVGRNGTGLIRRALLHFDVAAAVPPGARILDARLSFRIAPSITTGQTATAHRVLQDWGEGASVATAGGGGGGAPAAPNDATWLYRFYPAAPWANPGGDFAPSPSFAMPLYLGVNQSPSTPAATADAQLWLDQPGQNFGWLLRNSELSASTANRIESRESGGPVLPTLSVTYMLPGTSGWHGIGCPTGVGSVTYDFTFGGAPLGGATIQLLQSNGPPSALAAHLFALDLDPVGVPLTTGCTLYLPLAGIIAGPGVRLDPSGAAATPFAVPAGFPGYLVACQAVALDGTNPFGFVISNTGLICLQ